jgi:hypothetical protein
MTKLELLKCADLKIEVNRLSKAIIASEVALHLEEEALNIQQRILNSSVEDYNHAKKRTAQDANNLKQQSTAYDAALAKYNATTLFEHNAMVESLNQNVAAVNGLCSSRDFRLEDALTLNQQQRMAMDVNDRLEPIEEEQHRRAGLADAMPDNDGWIAIDISNGVVRVPVKINGMVATAIIDSGAEINGISESFLVEHKDQFSYSGQARLKSVFATKEKTLVSNVNVSIFGAKLLMNELIPVTLDRSQILLGAPFLQLFVLQIDYPNRRIRFLDRNSVSLTKVANVPMIRSDESTLPMIRVSIAPNEDILVNLDTGNNGGLFLSRRVATRLGLLDKYKAISEKSIGSNGEGSVESFRIPYFKVGPFEMENVKVDVPSEHQTSSVGEKQSDSVKLISRISKGLMGYDILKHFVVTLDYYNMEMHLGVPETVKLGMNASH